MNKIALAQMCSTEDVDKNTQMMSNALRIAVEQGAQLVAYPENCLYLGSLKKYDIKKKNTVQSAIKLFTESAREKNIAILIGSVLLSDPNRVEKWYNASLFISQTGEISHVYRKIHLFDADVPGARLQESDTITPGSEVVAFKHDIAFIGLSICYDIRFPTLYQRLRNMGAELIFIPAAFTVPTGKAHWLTLLKARAIENQVYIAAPAQFGAHSETRSSFGSSAIIDPWGDIVSIAEDNDTLIIGEINTDRIKEIRRQMPVSQHLRENIDII